MSIIITNKEQQASGNFNGGEILENKPIGFPQDGGSQKPYSNILYWAHAWTPGASSTIGLHPHQGFEIMSFVLNGSIKHFDTKSDHWIPLKNGDVQLIQAGNGVSHAEKINKDSSIFQIWFDPDLSTSLAKPASYTDYPADAFSHTKLTDGKLIHYAGPEGKITLETAGINILEYRFNSLDESLFLTPGQFLSAYLIDGVLSVNGLAMNKDDFLLVDAEETLRFTSNFPGRFFIILSPKRVPYPTYAQQIAKH